MRLKSADGEPAAKDRKPVVRVSVRNLVEFILRSGDIDSRSRKGKDLEAAQAGSRIHRKIQKSRKGDYTAEYRLAKDTDCGDFVIRIEGRADGIIGGDLPSVEEIKGTCLDVSMLEEPEPVHLAQARCYAAIYAEENGCAEIGVRMTYVNFDSEEVRLFEYEYGAGELAAWYADVVGAYRRWAQWQISHVESRNRSMEDLPFPFPYREGQRKLTQAVYLSIRDKHDLFLMAPTGVGKTMSCVYPAVRAVGEGHGDRVFYLTAKNETLAAGREAFSILMDRGLDFRTVLITSKEKICPMREPSCNPEDCPYAKGHFDRINDAVFDALQAHRFFDRDVIRAVSEERKVCPFELTLDISSFADAVLGDYNYAFDPNVRLQRFFGAGSGGDGILLVDEAHNLVERGRSMYSAALVKEHVLAAKRTAGKLFPQLKKALDRVNRLLLSLKHSCEEAPTFESPGGPVRVMDRGELPPVLSAVLRLQGELQAFFESCGDGKLKDSLLDFHFEVMDFISASEYLDENYEVCCGDDEEGNFALKLFCVNPAARLTSCVERGRCAILFSATLLPISYYRNLLTTREDARAIYAESPFDGRKRVILAGGDVSTRYSRRGPEMYRRIALYISEIAGSRQGNYMVFFPSYRMLNDVLRIYRKEFDRDGVNWVAQTPGMQEDDREIFLENFYDDPADTLIGFCVMGGMFAEGIDLTGTKLIGAVVVGAGIPQVSGEREILKRHFDSLGESGFDCAYRFPGMNRVLQAAGRVIRTATDIGVIALLDERFLSAGYRALFPREWREVLTVTADDVRKKTEAFWREADRTGTDLRG